MIILCLYVFHMLIHVVDDLCCGLAVLSGGDILFRVAYHMVRLLL